MPNVNRSSQSVFQHFISSTKLQTRKSETSADNLNTVSVLINTFVVLQFTRPKTTFLQQNYDKYKKLLCLKANFCGILPPFPQ